jgi:hypothetical protein
MPNSGAAAGENANPPTNARPAALDEGSVALSPMKQFHHADQVASQVADG